MLQPCTVARVIKVITFFISCLNRGLYLKCEVKYTLVIFLQLHSSLISAMPEDTSLVVGFSLNPSGVSTTTSLGLKGYTPLFLNPATMLSLVSLSSSRHHCFYHNLIGVERIRTTFFKPCNNAFIGIIVFIQASLFLPQPHWG